MARWKDEENEEEKEETDFHIVYLAKESATLLVETDEELQGC